MLKFVFTKTARYPGLEVEHYQIMRNLRTLFINFKYRGFLMTLLGLAAAICGKAKIPFLQEYRFNKQNLRESGLDTDGIVEPAMMDIPAVMRRRRIMSSAMSWSGFILIIRPITLLTTDRARALFWRPLPAIRSSR